VKARGLDSKAHCQTGFAKRFSNSLGVAISIPNGFRNVSKSSSREMIA
jgi:hypothetical protein